MLVSLASERSSDSQLEKAPGTTVKLGKMFRMPAEFGPAPGPRNVPEERSQLRYVKEATVLEVTARTDPKQLAALLPERCRLDGEPRIEVSVTCLTNVGWLAGRGYNIVMVRVPAVYTGREETLRGWFLLVVWESLADPILTGREELGWPKLPAEVPAVEFFDGQWRGCASWQGYRFFDIEASGFEHAEPPVRTGALLTHKYIPKTGSWGTADISYMAANGTEVPPKVHSFQCGSGHFAFHAARWEDMPTQYPIVNRLAALPLDAFETAFLMKTSGGGDLGSQRILR